MEIGNISPFFANHLLWERYEAHTLSVFPSSRFPAR
jgi:hypothetical protein